MAETISGAIGFKIEANTSEISGEDDKFDVTYRLLDLHGNLIEKELFVSNYASGPVQRTVNEVTYTKLVSDITISNNAGSGIKEVAMDIPLGRKLIAYEVRILSSQGPPPEENFEIEDPRP